MLLSEAADKKFRLWYNEKQDVWVVDAIKIENIYHPFVGSYDFSTNLSIFTGVVKIGISHGVKPEEILLID